MMTLYKYRSFQNLEYALDIFVNKRLFGANFKDLNDPMEGRYIYTKGLLGRGQIRDIRGDKERLKVLSLSETERNMLMWSYYADAHAGFVVGVKIDKLAANPIEYVDDLKISEIQNANAQSILSRKLKLWEHEQERRVFKPVDRRESPFIEVKITELIFGTDTLKTNAAKAKILEAVAKKFCPRIKVRTLERTDLDQGNLR